MQFIKAFQLSDNRINYYLAFLNVNQILKMYSIKEFRAVISDPEEKEMYELSMKTKIIIAPSTGQTITGQSIGSNVFYSHIDLIDIVNELEKGSNNEE